MVLFSPGEEQSKRDTVQDPSNSSGENIGENMGEKCAPLPRIACASYQDKGSGGSQIKHDVSCQEVITSRVPSILVGLDYFGVRHWGCSWLWWGVGGKKQKLGHMNESSSTLHRIARANRGLLERLDSGCKVPTSGLAWSQIEMSVYRSIVWIWKCYKKSIKPRGNSSCSMSKFELRRKRSWHNCTYNIALRPKEKTMPAPSEKIYCNCHVRKPIDYVP